MKETTKKDGNPTKKYTDIRERFLNLRINDESIWGTKLRGILNSDIHEKPLGCKISNTHIRIGKVHLDTFYEAQILFSHAHWVQRFANELSLQIAKKLEGKASIQRIVLVGYETYIEPVMYLLRKRLMERVSGISVMYCIFEEQKYTYLQHVKPREIRYIETAFQGSDTKEQLEATQVFFICGISTTLSTYERMRDQLEYDLEHKIDKNDESKKK